MYITDESPEFLIGDILNKDRRIFMKKEITIRKALNLKNKITGDISAIRDKIIRLNNYRNGSKTESELTEVSKLNDQLMKKESFLIDLKTKIHQKNAESENYNNITLISEFKSLIDFYTTLRNNTQDEIDIKVYEWDADHSKRIITDIEEMRAHISKSAIDGIIGGLKDKLEDAFDAVETFNASNKISIDVD